MGAERKSAVIEEKNRRLVAYHEGGHALVAMHTEGAMPVHKATIMPRGRALGMVRETLPCRRFFFPARMCMFSFLVSSS